VCGFSKESMVPFASNHGKIITTRLLIYDLGEFLFTGCQFFAGENALSFQQPLLDQLGSSGLDCEIRLGKGDFFFPWITILCDQVAGVTRKHDVIYLTLATGPEIDHFVDVNKMVSDGMS
jgi:hypothetical protein